MGKMKILGLTAFLALALVACGEEEKTEKKPVEKANAVAKKDSKENEDSSDSKESSELLNPNLEKETEGKIEILYTNSKPNYNKDFEGFKVSVDEYQFMRITDMNQSAATYFDGQTEGYVLTTKVTINNETDKPKAYNNTHHIRLTSNFDSIPGDKRYSIKEEDRIVSKKEKEVSMFGAGEKVTGLMTYTITNEEFQTMQSVKPKYVIEGGVADDKTFKGSISGEGVFDFVYSEEQSKEVAAESHLYPDKLTTDNMADKKMIFEKEGINETKQIGEVKATLEGVQFTEVTPTEAHKPRFKNFGEGGIVALTVKMKFDNGSKEPIDLISLMSMLSVDDNRARILSQGMVEPREPGEIAAGESGEKYHVFLMRKDEFEIYKKFEMELGPFVGDDGKYLFKGQKVTFNIPR